MKKMISEKAERFTESVIREMTRLAHLYDAVNLSQGFPDFPAPEPVKTAAIRAIEAEVNQYAITWGAKSFRDAICRKYAEYYQMELDPERELTVCCGSTEAMISALMAIINPGDEVIVFEPFYENYGPDAILSGATPRFVKLYPPKLAEGSSRVWYFDGDELASAFNDRTKAIVINTPNNPTGKVFTRAELELIAQLCQKWNVIAVTDEIYEHIVYDGAQHIPMATLDGMRDRTITINGMSKTYSVTGWRVGFAIAPPALTSAIRKVHDFLTVGAPAPLQEAGVLALSLPSSYYEQLARDYAVKRARLLGILNNAGFGCFIPYGAYYIMTDISKFGFETDVAFAQYLVKDIGVAVVPGSSFYNNPAYGYRQVRFAFCKREATIQEAEKRMQRLHERVKG
ncbi:MAG: aminotransferase class I/II-fold pyridoxal phosphate-dependent enzyme [Acidobacteria bacterium]|nr:aminotransferase class I/II-fold pyridoxal phosphate-dependent enzyme [Acidobacteriota bacterium]